MEQTKLVQAMTRPIVEKACNTFLIVDVSVSKPGMKKTLPKEITAKIAQMIAAAKGDGEITAPDTQVPLFGNFYKEFNNAVLNPLGIFRNSKVYTRLELDGGRAFTTAEFPVAYPAFKQAAADTMTEVIEAVEARYDIWVEAGISSAIRTYEPIFPQVESWIRRAIPTKDQFIENCSIEVGLPRRIDTGALKGVSLPAELLADIQQQQAEQAQVKLEGARGQAIKMVKDHLDKISTQLDGADNRRLHDTLITNLQGSAATLRGFVNAYDSDPRILEICDIIDERIASVNSAEVWKNSIGASEVSRRVAIQTSKQLADLGKRKLPPVTATADSIEIAEGGMLADLL